MDFDHNGGYFHLNAAGCRRAGAKGGRRSAEVRKLRQAMRVPQTPLTEPHLETAAEAITVLDERFPWLRGAERCPSR